MTGRGYRLKKAGKVKITRKSGRRKLQRKRRAANKRRG
jgi:hypothetical protein